MSSFPATRWLILLVALVSTPADADLAPDGLALSLGQADNPGGRTHVADTRAFRLGLAGPLPLPWLPERWQGWGLETGYITEVGHWSWPEAGNTTATSLDEFGLIATLRAHPAADPSLYLEVGTGPRLLSRSEVSGRELSTDFHFGSHGGVGVRFGPEDRLDAALLIQHLSNADIEIPNPGINFYQLRLIVRPAGW